MLSSGQSNQPRLPSFNFFFYNMLTKQEVVEMLSDSREILEFEQYRIALQDGKIDSMHREDSMMIVLRWIYSYEKIIQHILDKLDETTSS